MNKKEGLEFLMYGAGMMMGSVFGFISFVTNSIGVIIAGAILGFVFMIYGSSYKRRTSKLARPRSNNGKK